MGEFAAGKAYEDLPEAVVRETRRIIFDCIICAVAGTACDKGKISIAVARQMGGSNEASIIGTPYKVSCTSAAFAHGEQISALDFDSFEIPQGHIPPCLIPPPLSLAESTGASGKDLILATALAMEIESRIHFALVPRTDVLDSGAGMTRLAFGESQYIFGGAAGAAKILGLDKEMIAHALSIAVHFCPVPVGRKFQVTESPAAMTKYGESGWPAMGGVAAAMLAQGGYVGDLTAFDGKFGFWRMYSYGGWEPEKALDRLGQEWIFQGIGFKPYPCHRTINGPLDAFTAIINRYDLRPEEIERVRVFGNPKVMNQYRKEEIETQVAAQFNVPHNIACAAFRLKPGPTWQAWDTLKNEEIIRFRKKILSEEIGDWEERVSDDPRKRWGGAVEVTARGEVFKEDQLYARGTAFTDFELTDGEMEDKFRNSAVGILPDKKIEKAIQYLSDLEQVKNVRDLMSQVTL